MKCGLANKVTLSKRGTYIAQVWWKDEVIMKNSNITHFTLLTIVMVVALTPVTAPAATLPMTVASMDARDFVPDEVCKPGGHQQYRR